MDCSRCTPLNWDICHNSKDSRQSDRASVLNWCYNFSHNLLALSEILIKIGISIVQVTTGIYFWSWMFYWIWRGVF